MAAQEEAGSFEFVVLNEDEARSIVSSADTGSCCYRYRHRSFSWEFAIASHIQPGRELLSLGGFRIVPAERAELPGFTIEKEAIGLATGMEKKVFWARHLKVGGPRGLQRVEDTVGGKCVLLPAAGGRVGEERDKDALAFAIECLKHFEEATSNRVITGQDLGHGLLSDGKTTSLDFLHERFRGSVTEDTSKPTAEGNVQILLGMLTGLNIPVENARIGLIGCGNIGFQILKRLRELGMREITCLETSAVRRKDLRQLGVEVFDADQKLRFLQGELDAVAINAAGGSLDQAALEAICGNSRLRIITGCENLLFSAGAGAVELDQARKLFAPTELCGMLGYLTAIEEYLCSVAGEEFSVKELFQSAKRLQIIGHGAAQLFETDKTIDSFADAVRLIGGENE